MDSETFEYIIDIYKEIEIINGKLDKLTEIINKNIDIDIKHMNAGKELIDVIEEIALIQGKKI